MNFIINKNKTMIPANDIKIKPNTLKYKLIEEIDTISTGFDFRTEDTIKKIYRKKINEILHNDYFWYLVAGTKICTHKYKYGKKVGTTCGRPIYSKHKNLKEGEWLCSKHLTNHIVEKPRILGDDDFTCNIIKTNGERCKYKSKIDGICSQHYKSIHKMDIKEVHEKIKEKNKIDIIKNNTKSYNSPIYNKNIIIIDEVNEKIRNDDIKFICFSGENVNNISNNLHRNIENENNNNNANSNIIINNYDEDNISDPDNLSEISSSSDESEKEHYLNNTSTNTYIDLRYIEKYTEYLSNELDTLEKINNNTDKIIWIENLNNSIEFLCFVPDIFTKNIITINADDIENNNEYLNNKEEYLKQFIT